jgi:hypothetical protein
MSTSLPASSSASASTAAPGGRSASVGAPEHGRPRRWDGPFGGGGHHAARRRGHADRGREAHLLLAAASRHERTGACEGEASFPSALRRVVKDPAGPEKAHSAECLEG